MKESKILLTGGTGKTGRRVADRLTKLGKSIRIGSRNGNTPFDWEEPQTWQDILDGITSVYLTFQPDLAVPGAAETINAFVNTAIKKGVKKIVLLSGRGEPEAQKCEQIVMDSGIDWTILRSSWFSQNFSENYFLEPLLYGYVALPAGKIGEPFIDADDIADAAVAALTDERHSNKLYEITGPVLLTFEEAVSEISQATGRQIIFEQISIEEYSRMLNEYNVPDYLIELICYLFGGVMDGRNEYITNGVQQILGRKPKNFSEYIQKTIKTGVWTKNYSMQN